MVKMLVIARPELLPGIQWIELCLRVGVDPGYLCRQYNDAIIEQILEITDFKEVCQASIHQYPNATNFCYRLQIKPNTLSKVQLSMPLPNWPLWRLTL